MCFMCSMCSMCLMIAFDDCVMLCLTTVVFDGRYVLGPARFLCMSDVNDSMM